MKRILIISAFALALSSCYKPYIKDFDYDGVYIANQYDLRSFVVGEGMSFQVGAVLGGAISNSRDRKVEFVFEDALVTGDLSSYGGTTAIDGLLKSPSQSYVTTAITAAGIENVTPAPRNLYKLDADGTFYIRKGNHTGVIEVEADSLAMIADPHIGHSPYYALGWRIVAADADTVLRNKCFGIVAIRLENMFFGCWYHGGKSYRTDAAGQKIDGSDENYPARIPSSGGTSNLYTLTTTSAYECGCDYFHNASGRMTIRMDGKRVSVAGEGITDLGSSWNKAPHIQDRKVYLNYKYVASDGSFTVVTDTLTFRNRERDGVNEWQN